MAFSRRCFLGSVAVGILALREARAIMADSDEFMRVCAVNEDGRLVLTTRIFKDGTPWTKMDDIGKHAGEPGRLTTVACADMSNGYLSVIVISADNHVWFSRATPHPITTSMSSRASSIQWSPFEDMGTKFGQNGGLRDVACSPDDRDLDQFHACLLVDNNVLRHTIRFQNGRWPDVGVVKETSTISGSLKRISCAHADRGLHVSGITDDGLWHSIRLANGKWTDFGRVREWKPELGKLVDVSCSKGDRGLNVCCITEDSLWHTIRQDDGKWLDFGRIREWKSEVGKLAAVSCAKGREGLHVCTVTESGGLWHTIRFDGSGRWQGAFGDVKDRALGGGIIKDVGLGVN